MRSQLAAARAEAQRLRFSAAEPTRAALRDPRFEIAFLEGNYAAWQFGGGATTQGAAAIAVATADGRLERRLIRTSAAIIDFNWARRGAAIYFLRNTDYPNRFELRSDGIVRGVPETVPAARACISSPAAASTGAFLQCGETSVYLVRRGDEKLVLQDKGIGDTAKEDPVLAPDGHTVAFVETAQYDPPDVWLSTVAVASGRQRRLASVAEPLQNLQGSWQIDRIAWSPDSRWLAFSAHDGDGAREAIYRVNADGSGFRRVLDKAGRPAISPDGKLLAFDSRRNGTRAVFVARIDGTDIHSISHGSREAYAPRWRAFRRHG